MPNLFLNKKKLISIQINKIDFLFRTMNSNSVDNKIDNYISLLTLLTVKKKLQYARNITHFFSRFSNFLNINNNLIQ